jgi:hypothetical protein
MNQVNKKFNMIPKRKLIYLSLISAMVLTTAALGRQIKTAQAITVSPIRIELSADRGQTVPSSFKVFNEQNQTLTFYVNFARFETKDETGEPSFVPGSEGLPSWVKAPATVTIPPKQYLIVPFEITVPKDVDPGGYFAAIFISTIPLGKQDANNINLRSNVGTLLLFRVNGEFKEGETILEFNTRNKQHWFSSLPVEFYYRFQNSGADRAKPLGDITIKNLLGTSSKIVNANRSAGNTLPQSIRRYEAAWTTMGGDKTESNLGPVEHLADNASWVQTIRWEWQHFALGRYSANVHLTVNNDSSRSYSAHTSFWVIPWQLLVTIGAGVALLLAAATSLALLIIWLILKRRRGSRGAR